MNEVAYAWFCIVIGIAVPVGAFMIINIIYELWLGREVKDE